MGDQVVRYGELWDQTRAYAGALRARGIGPGDRVAMIVPNVPDFARVYYGVLALGAVVVPVHLLFKAEEIEFVLRDSGATLLVAAAPMLAEAAPAAARAGIPLLTVLVPDGMDVPFPRLEDEAAAAERDRPVRVRAPDQRRHDPLHERHHGSAQGRRRLAPGDHRAGQRGPHRPVRHGRDDVVFGGLPLFHTFGQVVRHEHRVPPWAPP